MDTTSDLETLTATEVIDGVRAAREDEHEAQLRQLQLAVAWALLHPCADPDDAAGWHDQRGLYEGIAPLAGPGAPLVDEYAPASFAAALGITLDAAKQMLGDG